MAMTDLRAAVRRAAADPQVAGDAVRIAIVTELLMTVAATVRFLLLDRQSWTAQRWTEAERDLLRQVVERVEAAGVRDLLTSCPFCGAIVCSDGCPLNSVRALAQAAAEQADETPDTEEVTLT